MTAAFPSRQQSESIQYLKGASGAAQLKGQPQMDLKPTFLSATIMSRAAYS